MPGDAGPCPPPGARGYGPVVVVPAAVVVVVSVLVVGAPGAVVVVAPGAVVVVAPRTVVVVVVGGCGADASAFAFDRR